MSLSITIKGATILQIAGLWLTFLSVSKRHFTVNFLAAGRASREHFPLRSAASLDVRRGSWESKSEGS